MRWLVSASLALLFAAPAVALAETATEAPAPSAAHATHRFGFEMNAVQPFIPTVHILRPKLTWTIWGEPGALRGDAIVGAYLRPHIEHDILETIDEYMGTVGYRQYFVRGLHLETMLSAGAAWGTNRFDGKDYATPTLFMDVNAGYRFGLFEPGGFFHDASDEIGLFVTVQGGTLFSLGVSDIGPRRGKPDYFATADVLVGVSF